MSGPHGSGPPEPFRPPPGRRWQQPVPPARRDERPSGRPEERTAQRPMQPRRPNAPKWYEVNPRRPPAQNYPVPPQPDLRRRRPPPPPLASPPPYRQPPPGYPAARRAGPAAPLEQSKPLPGTHIRNGWFGQGKYSERRLLIAAGAAVACFAVVALILGVRQLGSFHANELDVDKAQAAVRQVLTDPVYGYGRNNVSTVSCNGGRNPVVQKGGTFTCEVHINGTKRQVTVVFRDDNGTYEVDRPR